VKNKDEFNKGVMLILAAALTGAISQLLWKFGTDANSGWIWYLIGFVVAAISAMLMMLSFRYGEISILQPLMSLGYIFSMILGYFFLGEPITLNKIVGTVFVIIGAAILAIPDKLKKAAVVGKNTTKKAGKAVSTTTKKAVSKTKSAAKNVGSKAKKTVAKTTAKRAVKKKARKGGK